MKAIAAEKLFDSQSGSVKSDQVVLVEGRKIVSVERNAGLSSIEITERAEFPDCTLLPGLIDCHVHLAMDGEHGTDRLQPKNSAEVAVLGMAGAQATLRGGVTTVRCVGTPGNVDVILRDAVKQGRIVGPHIVAAGRPISITGGHAHTMAIEADGADSIATAVRSQVKAGVDVIKLMVTGGVLTPGIRPGTPQMSREELSSAIVTAHRAGRKVCGHAEGPEGVQDAVLCGIDSIEHGYLDAEGPVVKHMLDQATFLVPTMIAYQAILDGRDSLASEAVDNAERAILNNQMTFTRAVDAGLPIAMGSDAGTPFNPHGQNWREAHLMVQHGLAPTAALQAATIAGATLLDLPDRGVIKANAVADLLVIDGDPTEDISALASIHAVWANGRRIHLQDEVVS